MIKKKNNLIFAITLSCVLYNNNAMMSASSKDEGVAENSAIQALTQEADELEAIERTLKYICPIEREVVVRFRGSLGRPYPELGVLTLKEGTSADEAYNAILTHISTTLALSDGTGVFLVLKGEKSSKSLNNANIGYLLSKEKGDEVTIDFVRDPSPGELLETIGELVPDRQFIAKTIMREGYEIRLHISPRTEGQKIVSTRINELLRHCVFQLSFHDKPEPFPFPGWSLERRYILREQTFFSVNEGAGAVEILKVLGMIDYIETNFASSPIFAIPYDKIKTLRTRFKAGKYSVQFAGSHIICTTCKSSHSERASFWNVWSFQTKRENQQLIEYIATEVLPQFYGQPDTSVDQSARMQYNIQHT